MFLIVKSLLALILVFSYNLFAEEVSNFDYFEKPYKNNELKSGAYFS